MAARTVDVEAHAERRDAFIDVAQRLIQSKGYEQMSIQDVLDETGASRGAFYHYFTSKAALLEAVVDRFTERALSSVRPLVEDPELDASAKLEGLFASVADWKLERIELMRALLRVWESDDNALMREKVRQATMTGFAPLLAAVLRQGAAESVFTVDHPDETAMVLVGAMTGSRDGAVRLFLQETPSRETLAAVESLWSAVEQAFERVLGVEPGSLTVFDRQAVRRWFS
jgi:AcrR family transcriptional regulator